MGAKTLRLLTFGESNIVTKSCPKSSTLATNSNLHKDLNIPFLLLYFSHSTRVLPIGDFFTHLPNYFLSLLVGGSTAIEPIFIIHCFTITWPLEKIDPSPQFISDWTKKNPKPPLLKSFKINIWPKKICG